MNRYKIPENQLFIHDDESCPCGSDKRYVDCCKGKPDKIIQYTSKPAEVLVREAICRSLEKHKCCMHPAKADCRKRIKAAHALQNNKILSLLSGSGNHVIIQNHTTLTRIFGDPTNPDVIIPFTKLSRNKATTLGCFCDLHDDTVFTPIEKNAPSFDPTNDQMKFLYAYKAFIFEYAKQYFLMKMMQDNFAERPSVFSMPEQILYYRVQCMRMAEMEPIKQHFDKEILNNTYNGIYTEVITIPYRIGFACYSYIGLDYDIDGELLDPFDDSGRMHRLAVTILPENTQSYIMISCMQDEVDFYKGLFAEIQSYPMEKIIYYFNAMMPLYSENLVLNEGLWTKLGEKGQVLLTTAANMNNEKQIIASSGFAAMLRNAKKDKKANYSKRGAVDLFQQI